MARDPRTGEELPDSVMLQQFQGLRNNVSEERLGPGDLLRAKNIDIDDAGEVRRRRGSVRVAAGVFHSAYTCSAGTFVVKDGDLGRVNRDYSFAPIVSGVGPQSVAYVDVDGTLFFSSETVSGVIQPGDISTPWGASVSEGTWVSPVINPTATLSPVKGRMLGAPPLATALTHMNGRIYLANGTTLWATELYLYHYVDKTRTFLQMGSKITALGRVSDGIYAGTQSAVYFLSGPFGEMRRMQVMDVGIIPGSMVSVDAASVLPESNGSQQAVMFMTERGLCVGLNSGIVQNKTQERMVFPEAASMSAMYRDQDGIGQFVGVADSAGTPSSAARVGDYVDAEIIRFQGA